MANYSFLLATRLSQDQQSALELLQQVCRALPMNVYFSGGSMRDLLTGHTVRLLNFTVEGDPLRLQSGLAAAGAERLSARADAATLSLSLRGCRMRIQAARGAQGTLGATIHEDLRRRSLTLNSIGLSLNPGSYGLPLDPANGAADIEERLIRMSHPYVFVEDPLAALRAVRLRTRLGFTIEERTRARLEAARDSDALAQATPAARGQELEAIAYEPDPASVLAALEKEQMLVPAFGAGMRTAKMNLNGLSRLTSAVEAWELLGMVIDVGLVAMPMLLDKLAPQDQARLSQALPSRHVATGWKKLKGESLVFERRLLAIAGSGGSWLRAAQELLEKSSCEAVIYSSLEPGTVKAAKKLREFYTLALQQRQRLPLGVLRALGMAPRSLRAEEILRPWYRRLLAGENLSDADLAEGVRRQAQAVNPAPAPTSLPAAPSGRPGRRLAPPTKAQTAQRPKPAPPPKRPAKSAKSAKRK